MSGYALPERGLRWWPALRQLTNIERFIPANRIARTPDHQHARLFLLSHTFGPFIGFAICGFLILNGFPADYRLIGFAALVGLFWAYPFALRAGAQYRLMCLASLQHLALVILWASFGYGGFTSPILLWLVIVPLLAFLYLSPSYRLWFGLLGMLTLNVPFVRGLRPAAADAPGGAAGRNGVARLAVDARRLGLCGDDGGLFRPRIGLARGHRAGGHPASFDRRGAAGSGGRNPPRQRRQGRIRRADEP